MNAKTSIGYLALAAMLLSTNAWADNGRRHGGPQYGYAQVISADPIIHYVTVKAPVRECWEEMRYYTVDRGSRAVRTSTLVGALIGGVVGNQFGSGRGNEAATVAGTLIGGAIANDAANKRHGGAVEQYGRPVQRCETRYRSHQEERIDGYRVAYRFHGQKYVTEMPYDPGNRLRVRVDIRPAG